MKVSFYFFLWIIIYPLLGLLHSPWIMQNSFIVAIIFIFGLSWLINRSMPDTIRYERVSAVVTIMEEAFTGDVKAVKRRLYQKVSIEFVTAIYFGVTFVFILFSMVRGSAEDWIALLIFGFFAFGAISRAFKLNQAYTRLKQNPTPEECEAVIENAYGMDYRSYYNNRLNSNPANLLPPRPKHFKAFQIFSLIISLICSLFGLFYLIMSVITLSQGGSNEIISAGIMYFLYGSLAAYYGIKDSYSSVNYFRRQRKML